MRRCLPVLVRVLLRLLLSDMLHVLLLQHHCWRLEPADSAFT